jgi:hypothetical protein
MASRGDVAKQIVFSTSTALPVSNVPDLPEGLEECCYELFLFVDTDALSDPLRNDQTSYFKYYPESFTAASFTIQKCENKVWVDKHVITDNTYGTFRDFGDEIKNGFKYISIKNILWSSVKAAFGEGKYRIEAGAIDMFSNVIVDTSFAYNVTTYTPDRAENTVWIKITNEGLLGDRNDASKRFAFPDGWEDGIRIQGRFGDDFSEFVEKHTVYNSRLRVYTEHSRIDKAFLYVDMAHVWIRSFLKNEILMADTIAMFDYNNNNANCHVGTMWERSGDFSPEYISQVSKANIKLEFRSAYETAFKNPCK